MGIDLATKSMPDRARPDEDSANLFQGVKEALKEHSRAMILAEGDFPPMPSHLGLFMDEQRGSIEEAVQVLLEDEPPCWERDVEKGLDSPIPNLLGHLSLQRMFLVEAGMRMNRGETSSVAPLLKASWLLNQSILAREELISYLIGLHILKGQLAIVRRTHSDLSVWRERLGSLNPEGVFFDTLQGEAWCFQRHMKIDSIWDMEKPAVRYLVSPVLNPMMRWCTISYSDAMRRAVQDLPRRDIHQVDSGSYFSEMMSGIPRWNFIARVGVPNVDDAWLRTVRIELGVELTHRVIEARELLDSGADFNFEPGVHCEPSNVPGFAWAYSVDSDAVTIALDREPYTSAPPIFSRLPLHYCLSLKGIGECDLSEKQ
jgi:hypothetical protein